MKKDSEKENPTHEDFLRADFDQCFSQMRHYDTNLFEMVKFIFTGYAAVISAVAALLGSHPRQASTLIGSSGLMFLGGAGGTILLGFLLRNRVYFTAVARFINEIRRQYLQSNPIGVRNEAGFYTDPQCPKVLSPGSSHFILMYFVAMLNALLLGAFVSILYAWFNLQPNCNPDFNYLCAIIVTVLVFIIELLWIILYAKAKDKKWLKGHKSSDHKA